MNQAVKKIEVFYGPGHEAAQEGEKLNLRLYTDAVRNAGQLSAELHRPGIFRDALLSLSEILFSDGRYKAQDRSDYLAYLLSQGKKASKELWNAQKAYLESKYGEADSEEAPLDPLVQVTDDGLAIEVFSADESSYARLLIKDSSAFKNSKLTTGTSHLRIDASLFKTLTSMRSYRQTQLEVLPASGAERTPVQVPYRWIRAFGQVQAASTLPSYSFELASVDLYNLFLKLRTQRAKTSPRALRYELVPGQAPRLVLEPWDYVIEGKGPEYSGGKPMVVRTWGRKRLMPLARLLPHAKKVTVKLIGAGLPAYYIVDLGDAELTVALSGWTDSGWAGISTFDLLAAGPDQDQILEKKLKDSLKKAPATLDELAESLKADKQALRQAALKQMQQGLLMLEPSTEKLHSRALFVDPPELEQLKYRDQREADAHRLLEVEDQVQLTKVHDLGGEGVRIEGEVDDKQAHRKYQTSFTLDREGRTVDASCTSPQFRQSGLREGPTVPMIALRLLYARQQAALEKARDTEEGRKLIRAETRIMLKRSVKGFAQNYRLSLDHRQVTVHWGRDPQKMRMQRFFFDRPEEARDAYFSRLDQLSNQGYIDASAAEAI